MVSGLNDNDFFQNALMVKQALPVKNFYQFEKIEIARL